MNLCEFNEGKATQMVMLNDCTARFLMCRPEHFAVSYTINPWMNPKRWARDAGAHAAAVGLEALHVIRDEGLVEKSRVLGAHMLRRLRAIASPALGQIRGRGLWVGAEIDPGIASARETCERLLAKGVLSKETHRTVVRLAPPLVIAPEELDWALDRFEEVLHELGGTHRRPAAA